MYVFIGGTTCSGLTQAAAEFSERGLMELERLL